MSLGNCIESYKQSILVKLSMVYNKETFWKANTCQVSGVMHKSAKGFFPFSVKLLVWRSKPCSPKECENPCCLIQLLKREIHRFIIIIRYGFTLKMTGYIFKGYNLVLEIISGHLIVSFSWEKFLEETHWGKLIFTISLHLEGIRYQDFHK